MKLLKMCCFRLKKNKSAWFVLCISLLFTIITVLDNEMGNTVYDREITSVTNGNWFVMFAIVTVCLVNAFYKNGYIKNISCVCSERNSVCIYFGITCCIYIAFIMLTNILIAVLINHISGANLSIGIAKNEILFFCWSFVEFCIVSYAIAVITVVTKSSFIGIIAGLLWCIYLRDAIDVYLQEIFRYHQQIEYILLMGLCVVIDYFLIWKKEIC